MDTREYNDVLNYNVQNLTMNCVKCCFRIKPEIEPSDEEKLLNKYYSEELWEDDEDLEDLDIQEVNGKFVLVHHVPRNLFKYIIGNKGVTRRKIECDTNTEIKVPRKEDEDGPILVVGPSRNAVIKSKIRIDMLLIDAKAKHPFTHFLSIPMTHDSIQKGFLSFRDSVRKNEKVVGLDESVFQNPMKLHLTIGTLELSTEEEQIKAQKVLMLFKVEVMDVLFENLGPFKIEMRGLEYMNDDPSEVDVLYAKVKIENDDNLLQDISNKLVEYYVQKGLMFKKYDQVKLHVTVMNTLFRRDKSGTKYNTENELAQRLVPSRETFDARPILDEYADWYFGTQELKSIHLSIRYSKHLKTGYYKPSYVQDLILM